MLRHLNNKIYSNSGKFHKPIDAAAFDPDARRHFCGDLFCQPGSVS